MLFICVLLRKYIFQHNKNTHICFFKKPIGIKKSSNKEREIKEENREISRERETFRNVEGSKGGQTVI